MSELTPQERDRIYREIEDKQDALPVQNAEREQNAARRELYDISSRTPQNLKPSQPWGAYTFVVGVLLFGLLGYGTMRMSHQSVRTDPPVQSLRKPEPPAFVATPPKKMKQNVVNTTASSSPKPHFDYTEYNALSDEEAKKADDKEDQKSVTVVDADHEVQNGYDYIRGSVQNDSHRPIKYWKVTTQFKNASGKIIDTAYTNSGETLLPDASKKFEIMHAVVPEAVETKTFVDEVVFSD